MEGLTSGIIFIYVFVCTCHRIISLSATLFRNCYNANLYHNTNKKRINENIQRAMIKLIVVKY